MPDLRLPKTIAWVGGLDGQVELVDQTLLPGELKMLACRDVEAIREAIVSLRVRGAPAIGVAAAMGLVLGVRDAADADSDGFWARLRETRERLASARPTAVNLCWALERMEALAQRLADRPVAEIKQALLDEARRIRDEDAEMCRKIGQAGQHLIRENTGVLTHCNAGSLATAEYGTALALLYAAHERGRRFRVYADETRPLLQGSRLTAWELSRAGIDVTVLCDNAAGELMREGRIQTVVTGADRIVANGDTANKIGTYSVAVIARAHGIPFYVAAPSSTFDFSTSDGAKIPIEHRSGDEVRAGFGRLTAPAEVPVYSPAFDVTPASLISGIVTERGVIDPVGPENIRDFFGL
jgi:methylthioribose-1-phosphate isomerase